MLESLKNEKISCLWDTCPNADRLILINDSLQNIFSINWWWWRVVYRTNLGVLWWNADFPPISILGWASSTFWWLSSPASHHPWLSPPIPAPHLLPQNTHLHFHPRQSCSCYKLTSGQNWWDYCFVKTAEVELLLNSIRNCLAMRLS